MRGGASPASGGGAAPPRTPEPARYAHCPSICVVIAGLNEAGTVGHTLRSLHGTYPRMEVMVVDDGSSDGMADVAREFAESHAGVLVLRRPQRCGKSSALNFALPCSRSEIIMCVDGDSQLHVNALWEIVQPFADPGVGAVSGTVLARNAFVNPATWIQGLEYLRCIFVGRRAAAGLNMLGIISGAFGAYLGMELCNFAAVIYFSTHSRGDLCIGLITPLMPLYNMLMRFITLISITEEILTRRSFRDSFVPVHVRELTWHW
jgi:glycosyltransferase involved in cell wall biosynthesis